MILWWKQSELVDLRGHEKMDCLNRERSRPNRHTRGRHHTCILHVNPYMNTGYIRRKDSRENRILHLQREFFAPLSHATDAGGIWTHLNGREICCIKHFAPSTHLLTSKTQHKGGWYVMESRASLIPTNQKTTALLKILSEFAVKSAKLEETAISLTSKSPELLIVIPGVPARWPLTS